MARLSSNTVPDQELVDAVTGETVNHPPIWTDPALAGQALLASTDGHKARLAPRVGEVVRVSAAGVRRAIHEQTDIHGDALGEQWESLLYDFGSLSITCDTVKIRVAHTQSGRKIPISLLHDKVFVNVPTPAMIAEDTIRLSLHISDLELAKPDEPLSLLASEVHWR
jgi:hypothetical protein